MPSPDFRDIAPAVAAFRQKLAAGMETALNQTVDQGYRLLKDQSPEKTGRFKAGWEKEIHTQKIRSRVSPIPTGELARIHNQTPYGPFLENGDTAGGWVEKTAICLEARLEALLAAVLESAR